MQLEGRVALVTGGAKRVGREIALALARRNARVVISYRSAAAEAEQTAGELKAISGDSLAVRAELSDAKQVRHMIERVGETFGRLDVLVNCASSFERIAFEKLTPRAWDRSLDANAKGPFLCALYASKLMRKHGGGKIINLADWSGVRPYKDYLPYCVSKGAVITLTRALAKELAPEIHVNAIAPGPILPPEDMSQEQRHAIAQRVPLKRWGSPEDIANTVVFLVEGTDFMTGSVVFVDGGQLIA